MRDHPEVVTVGEAMAMFLAEPGAGVPYARWFDASVAGAEANVAIGLSRLGHRVGYLGRVGADPLGEMVLRTLRAEGVDTTAVVVDSDRLTGLLIRDAPGGQPVQVVYRRGGSAGAALRVDDVPAAVIAAASVVHLTGITAVLSDTARDAVMATAEAAGHIIFDPNVRLRLASTETWRSVVEAAASRVDTVLVGSDELGLLDLSPAWFLDRGARLVVVKEGGRGAWATDGAQTWHTSARTVPVVDPVGAGDGSRPAGSRGCCATYRWRGGWSRPRRSRRVWWRAGGTSPGCRPRRYATPSPPICPSQFRTCCVRSFHVVRVHDDDDRPRREGGRDRTCRHRRTRT